MLRDKERHAAENSTFSQVQAPSVSARDVDQDYDSVYPDGGVTFQAPGESTPKSISQIGHNGHLNSGSTSGKNSRLSSAKRDSNFVTTGKNILQVGNTSVQFARPK